MWLPPRQLLRLSENDSAVWLGGDQPGSYPVPPKRKVYVVIRSLETYE
jgi:hypothetical protein